MVKVRTSVLITGLWRGSYIHMMWSSSSPSSLKPSGYQVSASSSSSTCCLLLVSFAGFLLLFLDVHMPRLKICSSWAHSMLWLDIPAHKSWRPDVFLQPSPLPADCRPTDPLPTWHISSLLSFQTCSICLHCDKQRLQSMLLQSINLGIILHASFFQTHNL